MKRNHTFKLSLLASLLCWQPVLAEDIEIYSNSNSGVGGVRPNILFILDTSGSMNDNIDVMEPADMPINNTDYSLRIGACFDNNRIYKLPNNTTLSDVTCSSTYQNNYYNRTQIQCQAALTAFTTAGYYQDTWSQWRSSGNPRGWNAPFNSTSDANFLECATDNGVHGNGGSSLYINPSSTTTPYQAGTSSWNSLSSTRKSPTTYTLYSGNYMNYLVTTANATPTPKIDIMRNVIENVLFGVDGVNIGLMKFNYRNSIGSNDGGVMKYPIIDVSATRNDLSNMKNWNASGGTPLSEALFEAYRVFAGAGKYFADRTTSESTEGSAILNGEPTHYDSPVLAEAASCQRQYIVYLTDGLPTNDANNATDKGIIESTIGAACDAPGYDSAGAQDNASENGKCLDDLTRWMKDTGFSAYLGGGVTVPNVKVTMYGIGFGSVNDAMRHAVCEGEVANTTTGCDYYYEAYNSTELTQVILDIIGKIKEVNTTFTSPAISVNAFNRSTHRSELYYTIFKPSTDRHWEGNLKRFRLNIDPNTQEVQIRDVNNQNAIDSQTGFFSPEATSWWTPVADSPDGNTTEKGGAASKLSNSMNVYTNVAGNDLSSAGNALTSANVTYAQLGIAADSTYRDTLLSWAHGVDVNDIDNDGSNTDARRRLGDPLHATPVLVQYGGTVANPDITAFMANNDGYLHAFNTSDGTEIFSFVPVELLGNLNVAYVNEPGAKLYGLDSPINAWVNDANKDGTISGSDHVYLYFGMGRGGRNVYAMDVTNRSSPTMLWTIHGGVDTDFTELGYTFSPPVHRKIRVGGQERHVIIFAGGYDMDQDSVFVRTVDDVGRAIYIVDALTGALIHRIDSTLTGFADMDYSIPSEVSAVDVQGDGLIDRLYVGDMGGQIWRIDIDNDRGRTSSDMSTIVTGGRLADLADASAISNRRFFYPPDVTLMQGEGEADYLAILIISGNRSHPLNKQVQDRAFMIKDRPIKTRPTTYETIVENDTTHQLYDASANVLGELSTATQAQRDAATAAMRENKGWFFNFVMSVGEKGLSKPYIMAGHAYFTTYTPPDATAAAANVCSFNEGRGWAYDIYVKNAVEGNPYTGQIGPANSAEARLLTALSKSGIPPEPKYIKPDVNNDCIVIGTMVRCLGSQMSKEKLYWFTR